MGEEEEARSSDRVALSPSVTPRERDRSVETTLAEAIVKRWRADACARSA